MTTKIKTSLAGGANSNTKQGRLGKGDYTAFAARVAALLPPDLLVIAFMLAGGAA